MRILYVTTIGGTMNFFKYVIKMLLDKGNIVNIASNINESPVPEYYMEWGCKVFPLSCMRTPIDRGNLLAIKEIKQLVKEEYYDIIHCHTPIASACVRIACRRRSANFGRIFYTAHGFHFFRNAPFKNWIIYYPIEWICAHWTDVLITINHEDYNLAKRKMRAQFVEYVPGIGVDIEKFSSAIVDRKKKRREIKIPENAKLILSVGELNTNKNHEVVIRAIRQMEDRTLHYVIAGDGSLKEYLERLALELEVKDQIHLLGIRTDVSELYKVADIYIHPSLREGLPVAVMEAIAAKIPVICSDIRGSRELIDSRYLFQPKDLDSVKSCIRKVIDEDLSRVVENNYDMLQKFDVSKVIDKMLALYMS